MHTVYSLSLQEVRLVQQLQALLWHLSFPLHQQVQGGLEDQQGPEEIRIWGKYSLQSDYERLVMMVIAIKTKTE